MLSQIYSVRGQCQIEQSCVRSIPDLVSDCLQCKLEPMRRTDELDILCRGFCVRDHSGDPDKLIQFINGSCAVAKAGRFACRGDAHLGLPFQGEHIGDSCKEPVKSA